LHSPYKNENSSFVPFLIILLFITGKNKYDLIYEHMRGNYIMNKITGFMGAALLAGGVLAGCSADSENAVPEENTADETVTPIETDEAEQTAEEAANDVSETTENAAEEVGKATQDLQENANNAADAIEQEATEIGDAVEEGALDAQESVDNATTTEEETAVTEGQEATGTFNGLADPHTVEIEVDGVPAAYQVNDDPKGKKVMAKFEKLTEGDSVTFVYVKDGPQLVINEVK
jgi:hypothetical protein